MLGNANGIDLNNATVNELSRIGGLGPILAARVIENRPIRRWLDLEKIEGFDRELINDLRGSGAKLGRPRLSTAKKPYNRFPKPSDRTKSAGARRTGSGRLAKNIFSGEE